MTQLGRLKKPRDPQINMEVIRYRGNIQRTTVLLYTINDQIKNEKVLKDAINKRHFKNLMLKKKSKNMKNLYTENYKILGDSKEDLNGEIDRVHELEDSMLLSIITISIYSFNEIPIKTPAKNVYENASSKNSQGVLKENNKNYTIISQDLL